MGMASMCYKHTPCTHAQQGQLKVIAYVFFVSYIKFAKSEYVGINCKESAKHI